MTNPARDDGEPGCWRRESISLRLFAVGALALLLLVPSAFVGALIDEREARRGEALDEVGSKWGEAQTVCGPILHVPFRRSWKDEKGQTHTVVDTATFLPDALDVEGTLTTEVRRRGIYDVVLYRADLELSGVFPAPRFDTSMVSPSDILWDRAWLVVGLTDMRGVEERVTLVWSGERLEVQPGVGGSPLLTSGLHRPVPVPVDGAPASIPFSLGLKVRGHDGIHVTPIAGRTSVAIGSTWPHPSYVGSFLPVEHTLDPGGFRARWRVLDLNRGFPQHWLGSAHAVAGYDFGVNLLYPTDGYQKSDRAHKYALLFVSISFLSLFFIEMLKNERVHVLNYILIGLGICLFYVLLLSLSEHLGFDAAYGIATLAITALITWHARNIFVQRRLCRTMGGVLLGLYGFLYVLLGLQDFALLFGSLGLFVILAGVMSAAGRVTRGPDILEHPRRD